MVRINNTMADLGVRVRYYSRNVRPSPFTSNMKVVKEINKKHYNQVRCDVKETYKSLGKGLHIDYLV